MSHSPVGGPKRSLSFAVFLSPRIAAGGLVWPHTVSETQALLRAGRKAPLPSAIGKERGRAGELNPPAEEPDLACGSSATDKLLCIIPHESQPLLCGPCASGRCPAPAHLVSQGTWSYKSGAILDQEKTRIPRKPACLGQEALLIGKTDRMSG